MGFFSTDFAREACQMSIFVHEQEVLPFGQVFILFHSKLEMPIYMKVVSLNKLDNFHKGRLLSV
jgi:hypothetical protein